MKKTIIPQSTTSQPYSRSWLEQYGRELTRDEITLVQAFRGLTKKDRAGLRELAAALVIARTKRLAGAR